MVPQVIADSYLLALPLALSCGNSRDSTVRFMISFYRKEVRQFHMEQHNAAFIKNPDWSLGLYTRSLVVRDVNGKQAHESSPPIVKLVDFFEGGQICHENGHNRSIEIHIQCCDNHRLPNSFPSEAYFAHEMTNLKLPKATFNSITEPSLCGYIGIVCSPFLCRRESHLHKMMLDSQEHPLDEDNLQKTTSGTDTVGVEVEHRANKLQRQNNNRKEVFVPVIAAIRNTCLMKQEEWWTYELCFNKGIRQIRFNVEQSVTPDGNVVQKQVYKVCCYSHCTKI